MFNPAQREAIAHEEGPMMVLAGPGSGKTTVITHRIGHLVRQCGISEREILVITFTVAAATEMRERYEKNVKGASSDASFGTFHRIFFGILRVEAGMRTENIVRPEAKYAFFRELLGRYQIEFEDEKEMIGSLMNEVSRVKEEMISLETYFPMNCSKTAFEGIYRDYQAWLRTNHVIDFDDMQVLVYKLFRKHPDMLARWQKRFRYILIDEFQDINRIQYEIVRLLAAPENNLFIVGDDDQSIYQFRGAKPDIMLGFPKDYPDVRQVFLGTNYRSTPEIVEAAGRLIRKNRKRFEKEADTVRPSGDPVEIRSFETDREQNEYLIQKIRQYEREGIPPERMAILVRTNTQPRLLSRMMADYNLEFQMKDRIPNLFDHWVAKDLLAYQRLAADCGSKGDFLRIMNRPTRYLSRAAVNQSDLNFYNLRKFYRTKSWMIGRISDMEADLKNLALLPPADGIGFILRVIGYDGYLKQTADERGMKVEELIQTVSEIQEMAKEYTNLPDWFEGVRRYEESLKERERRPQKEARGVHIVTMHGAKGLEYDAVFLPDANEGITPHVRAVKDAEQEEERRLFYVAMTRAIAHLHIFWPKKRLGKETDPSRFLMEMTESADRKAKRE